jgi:hypothetical protein
MGSSERCSRMLHITYSYTHNSLSCHIRCWTWWKRAAAPSRSGVRKDQYMTHRQQTQPRFKITPQTTPQPHRHHLKIPATHANPQPPPPTKQNQKCKQPNQRVPRPPQPPLAPLGAGAAAQVHHRPGRGGPLPRRPEGPGLPRPSAGGAAGGACWLLGLTALDVMLMIFACVCSCLPITAIPLTILLPPHTRSTHTTPTGGGGDGHAAQRPLHRTRH